MSPEHTYSVEELERLLALQKELQPERERHAVIRATEQTRAYCRLRLANLRFLVDRPEPNLGAILRIIADLEEHFQ